MIIRTVGTVVRPPPARLVAAVVPHERGIAAISPRCPLSVVGFYGIARPRLQLADKRAALSLPVPVSRACAVSCHLRPGRAGCCRRLTVDGERCAVGGMALQDFKGASSPAVMIRDPVLMMRFRCTRAWQAAPPFGFPQSMTPQSGRVRRKDNGLPAPFAACGVSRVDRSPPVSFRLFPRPVSFSVVRKTKERRNEP